MSRERISKVGSWVFPKCYARFQKGLGVARMLFGLEGLEKLIWGVVEVTS